VTKNTLIRSDKKHAVKMTAGSNVAERKTSRKFKEPETPVEAPVNIQKVAPVKTTSAKRKTASAPTKTVRAKATPAQAAPLPPSAKPTKAAKPTKVAKPRTAATKNKVDTTPADVQPAWDQDSPVKQRIDLLKTRNAQLAEQLQRLPSSPTARGTRP
jgi:hypothetical protein